MTSAASFWVDDRSSRRVQSACRVRYQNTPLGAFALHICSLGRSAALQQLSHTWARMSKGKPRGSPQEDKVGVAGAGWQFVGPILCQAPVHLMRVQAILRALQAQWHAHTPQRVPW